MRNTVVFRIFQPRSAASLGRKPLRVAAIALLLVSLSLGCATIAPFNPTAYEQATSLKVDSLSVMGKATGPFAQHRVEVEGLKLKLDKAYEYARGIPKNEITAKQWEILRDPDRHLLGGFLDRWQKESTLSRGYIAEKKRQVGEAFDTIIGLESGKIKPSEVK